jgi:putative endonuclease
MYYVYVLVNPENRRLYVGYSEDLKRRVREQAQSAHRGWKLAYYKAYLSETDARERERKLKAHGSGMVELKKRMECSVDMVNQTEEGRSERGQPTV